MSLSFSIHYLSAGDSTLAGVGSDGCTTTPNQNVGQCRQTVDGCQWNCVDAQHYTKDCSAD